MNDENVTASLEHDFFYLLCVAVYHFLFYYFYTTIYIVPKYNTNKLRSTNKHRYFVKEVTV